MMLEDKNFALVLGGGSARAIIHLGVIKWLMENDLKPKVIAGTSMGAVIGALYASGMNYQEMERVVSSLSIRKFLDIDILGKGGFIKGDKFSKYLTSLFGNKKFEDLEIKLKVNATDFNSGEEVVFTKGKLVPAIRASMNLPVIFLPFKHKSQILVDGGVINNLPINQVASYKVKNFLIINPYFAGNWFGREKKDSHNLWEVMERTVKLYSMSRYKRELAALPNKIYLQYASPEVKVYDFHKAKEIIGDGYRMAQSILSSQ